MILKYDTFDQTFHYIVCQLNFIQEYQKQRNSNDVFVFRIHIFSGKELAKGIADLLLLFQTIKMQIN